MNPLVQCPRCHTALPDGMFNQPALSPCPACETPVLVEIFPAFFRKANTGRQSEAILVDGESGCFYHPQKKAVLPCEGCGRFLCALCDCELNGQHFCPACLEAGKTRGKIKSLENNRTLYDSIALSLAVYPVLLLISVYFTFITAPMALFVAIRYWKSPLSLVRRSRFRFVIAISLALLQIIGWVALIISIAMRH